MELELCWVLIDCLKKDKSAFDAARLTDISSERWQAFLTLSKTQRGMPLLWHRLKRKGLDEAVSFEATAPIYTEKSPEQIS